MGRRPYLSTQVIKDCEYKPALSHKRMSTTRQFLPLANICLDKFFYPSRYDRNNDDAMLMYT
jgi:hypothetical protein